MIRLDWTLAAAAIGGFCLGVGLTVGAGSFRVIRRRYLENENER